MQIVHLVDMLEREQVLTHLAEIQALGCRLQEHVDGLAQEPDRPRHDEHADEDRGDGVRAIPPEGRDEAGRDEHGDRAEGVVDDLEEGCAHVEIRPAGPGEDHQADRVADEPDDAEDDHRARGDLRRLEQPPHAFDEHESADREEEGRLRGRPEDLGAVVAPRPQRRRRAACEARRDEPHRQAGDVGEHVRGVREEREAAGDDRADDLDDHHRDGDREDRREAPAMVGERRPVIVAVRMRVVAHQDPRTAAAAGHSVTASPVRPSSVSAAWSSAVVAAGWARA